MIQFNLLPDVKLEFIKTQRVKRLVISISILAGIAALVIFLILFLSVDVWQKKSISDLQGDIKTSSDQLKSTPDLDKILTVQNQLNALTSLHDQKPTSSRLFGFLSQLTPVTVTISDMTLDHTANTMSITGNSPSLDSVNTFVDALKFTKYTQKGSSEKTIAFNSVVLSTFNRDAEGATYIIMLNFDPVIFSDANEVKLVVPNIVTTRSVTEQPSILFEKKSEE